MQKMKRMQPNDRIPRTAAGMRTALAVAGLALAVATVPASANAAVRTGHVEDPQGDVYSLNGDQVDDLRSVSVGYDDAAGTVRVAWTYWTDVTQTPHNSYEVAAVMLEDARVVDGADISVWIDKASGMDVQPTLRLWGVSGTVAGTWQLTDSGHTLTAEFAHAALVGHDWQQALGDVPGGDQAPRFWFDGYSAPVLAPPGSAGTGGGSPVPTPDDSRVGMTINGEAQYTNDAHVGLSVIAPSWASTMKISNDGGFLASREQGIAARVPWTLRSSGLERLPKTVYVRFGSSTQTYTDDIILDQTKPTVTAASFAGSGATTRASAQTAASKRRTYRMRISARDATSGVAKVQFAERSKRHPSAPRKFTRMSRYKGIRAPKYVRVQDRAGNYSSWRSIR
jgi:hypothetical protein